jgi:predicted small metal-binding protein
MKYVLCPPCGTVFEGETEEEVIRVTQSHAKQKHSYVPSREEVLPAVTESQTPPGGNGTELLTP